MEMNEVPVPNQHTGSEKSIISKAEMTSFEEANRLFEHACQCLLQINHWHNVCGGNSALFQLTDSQGNPIDRTPAEGDYIMIDIPGPGSTSGEGYDWVRIERIRKEAIAASRYLLITVRPSPNPANDDDNTAHFFGSEATSNFLVYQEGSSVMAAVLGRNEVPNTETSNWIDKIRNAIVGSSAVLALSGPQWKSLTEGLLKHVKTNEK